MIAKLAHPITINENAWPAHRKHGDVLGNCSIETVTICDQTWMLKNLDVDHYRNGDPIPQVTDPAEWASLTTGAWSYLCNDPANGAIYGKLYNWPAVNDPRGLAPAGWHIPSNEEWQTLIDCLGGSAIAGGKLKEAGTVHWGGPYNLGATNESGFTALPGVFRFPNGRVFEECPFILHGVGWWWTSSKEEGSTQSILQGMQSLTTTVEYTTQEKNFGASVRCVKDLPASK